jgi:gamma-glutamylcyclotransferase (GGCT)/AIG2-like uncharacterized protein YtfP
MDNREGGAHGAAPALLFAYGTLMRGFSRNRLLGGATRYVGEAWAQGRLLALGSYPGIVDGGGTVRGELYRLDDPHVLAALDREEGYNFERRLTEVVGAHGRRARAWIYWYRGPQTRAITIPAGDWRSRWR